MGYITWPYTVLLVHVLREREKKTQVLVTTRYSFTSSLVIMKAQLGHASSSQLRSCTCLMPKFQVVLKNNSKIVAAGKQTICRQAQLFSKNQIVNENVNLPLPGYLASSKLHVRNYNNATCYQLPNLRMQTRICINQGIK